MSQDTSIQSSEGTNRKAIKRASLAGGIIVAIGLLGIGWTWSRRLMSDEEMIANFYANRDTFEQLHQMVSEEAKPDTWEMQLDVNGGYWSTYGPDISESRRRSYQALLRKIGMAAISAGTYQGEAPGGSLSVPRPVFPLLVPEKLYLFTPAQPTWSTITTEDTESDPLPLGREYCRQLEEQWYICLDARETAEDASVIGFFSLLILAIIILGIFSFLAIRRP